MIELTIISGQKVRVNVYYISYYFRVTEEPQECTRLGVTGCSGLNIKETPEEIDAIIDAYSVRYNINTKRGLI